MTVTAAVRSTQVKQAQEAFQAREAELLAALDAATNASSGADSERARWEEMLAAKERELAQLNAALGELSYESDAAERLRGELRDARAAVEAAQAEADGLRAASEGMGLVLSEVSMHIWIWPFAVKWLTDAGKCWLTWVY